jgi:hypothetical protein
MFLAVKTNAVSAQHIHTQIRYLVAADFTLDFKKEEPQLQDSMHKSIHTTIAVKTENVPE